MKPKSEIKNIFEQSAKIILDSKILEKDILASISLIMAALTSGINLINFENGGSAADSQHLSGELMGR